MRDPMAGLDAWLERPYIQAAEESERFIDWCEEHNIDPDDADSSTLYNDYLESQYDFEPDYEYEEDNYEYDR